MGTREYISKPKKVSTSLSYESKRNRYVVNWYDLKTGKKKTKIYHNVEEANEEMSRITNRLENELLHGEYDTLESRVRKFIKIEKELTDAKVSGANLGHVRELAIEAAQISKGMASDGRKIFNAVEDYYNSGDVESAEMLRKALNRSKSAAWALLGEEYKKARNSTVDMFLTKRIGGLARKLDERCRRKGGAKYRDECMSLLKQFSAKLDEWRASE